MTKAKIAIPEGLPDALIVHQLLEKTAALRVAAARRPPYAEWLKALRDQVAPELSYINVVFPQFTPHDEANHIHPLFYLAEQLLGSDLIERLNAAELFVLACSFYAHDWGMAVSENEKNSILGLETPDATSSFQLLDGERAEFYAKLKEQDFAESPHEATDISPATWLNHVRETHAARSAVRIKKFFSTRDPHTGDAIALVCEGHNLDVERLRDFDTARPVRGEVVNTQALALYLRLVDLFDIAQDRTPYALWKFVGPVDLTSKLEWDKHRAISSVVVDQYLDTGRIVKVAGSTDDHRVYAALEDLRDYCASQLRLSNGILNGLGPKYQSRLIEVDWSIKAQGFEPITVRFEFERRAMIRLLGDEIYQGDRYVFLRELLQNSIDAIRLRSELHKARGTGLKFEGAIHVEAEHRSDGHSVVRWSDNGAGMNRFIVQHYLAVPGRSFYRSAEFAKLGVQMDPISRFGVGILSCFMNSERVEIVTKQDGELEPSPESLCIEIADPARHFRIEQRVSDSERLTGTAVTLHLSKGAFAEGVPPEPRARLGVIEYLRRVAGFVEFPIYVKEGSERVVILHPKQAAKYRAAEGWQPVALDLSYSWSDFLLPQDVSSSRDYFSEESILIGQRQENSPYEGSITWPALRESLELRRDSGYAPRSTSYQVLQDGELIGTCRIRGESWPYALLEELHRSERSKSHDCNNMCRIYCDGILVPGVKPPFWAGPRGERASSPRIVLNIRRKGGTNLDLSRSELVSEGAQWDKFLETLCIKRFRAVAKKILDECSPEDAYYRLSRLVAYGLGTSVRLKDALKGLSVPLVVANSSGKIGLLPAGGHPKGEVALVPKVEAERVSRRLFAGWGSDQWFNDTPRIHKWSGSLSVFAEGMTHSVSSWNVSAWSACFLQSEWLKSSFELQAVRFLFPRMEGEFPLLQEIWHERGESRYGVNRSHPSDEIEKYVFPANAAMRELGFHWDGPRFAVFAYPFEEFFTAGWNYLNILHPVVLALAECLVEISSVNKISDIDNAELGKLQDAIAVAFRRRNTVTESYLEGGLLEERIKSLQVFFTLTKELGFRSESDVPLLGKAALNVPRALVPGKLGKPIESLSDVDMPPA